MSGTDIIRAGDPGFPGSKQRRAKRRRADNDDDMPQDLLEFNSPSAALVAMPPSAIARYMVWVIASMGVATIIVMGTFPVDRVVTTPGELVSTASTLLVQPLDPSIVTSIDVKEGEVVRKGQVLAHLDPTLSGADLTNLQQQTQAYKAQIERLQAMASGKDYVPDLSNPASTAEAAIFMRRQSEFKAKLLNYSQQILSLKSDMTANQASAAMYGGRAKLAGAVHNMRMELQHDQVGSRLDSLSAQDNLMEIERSQITAEQEAAGAQNKLDAMVSEEEGYVQNWKAQIYQDLTDAQHKYYEAKGDLDKAVLHQSLVVMRAQADAVVLTIAKVSIGSVLQAGAQFITLVPLDAPLEIEAKLKGSDSGYVKLGDKALIKFATFSYTQYGGAEAVVRNVSADSFTKDSGAANGTGGNGGAAGSAAQGGSDDTFYRIRLRVDRYTLHGVPNYFHPTPGMPVTADIMVGKRTILRYLLSTVLPVATEGMREP
jgi:HlyD family secretion protein